jgi:hypothetical protein
LKVLDCSVWHFHRSITSEGFKECIWIQHLYLLSFNPPRDELNNWRDKRGSKSSQIGRGRGRLNNIPYIISIVEAA